jgi:hypothetical protein
MRPHMTRAWVAPFDAGLVNLSMRFDKEGTIPSMDVRTFPRSREDRTPEQHVIFGLIDERDLPLLHDAIERYLHQRYMEDMAEHIPPR